MPIPGIQGSSTPTTTFEEIDPIIPSLPSESPSPEPHSASPDAVAASTASVAAETIPDAQLTQAASSSHANPVEEGGEMSDSNHLLDPLMRATPEFPYGAPSIPSIFEPCGLMQEESTTLSRGHGAPSILPSSFEPCGLMQEESTTLSRGHGAPSIPSSFEPCGLMQEESTTLSRGHGAPSIPSSFEPCGISDGIGFHEASIFYVNSQEEDFSDSEFLIPCEAFEPCDPVQEELTDQASSTSATEAQTQHIPSQISSMGAEIAQAAVVWSRRHDMNNSVSPNPWERSYTWLTPPGLPAQPSGQSASSSTSQSSGFVLYTDMMMGFEDMMRGSGEEGIRAPTHTSTQPGSPAQPSGQSASSSILQPSELSELQMMGLMVDPTALPQVIENLQGLCADEKLKSFDYSFFFQKSTSEEEVRGELTRIWLHKVMGSVDFEDLQTQPRTVERVLAVLHHTIQDPAFVPIFDAVLSVAVSSCDDRAMFGLNRMEVGIKLKNVSNTNEALEVFRGIYILDLLEKIARSKTGRDPISTHLGYQIQLADALRLPIEQHQRMRYGSDTWSGISAEDLVTAEKSVKEVLSNPENLIQFLMEQPEWLSRLDEEFSSEKLASLQSFDAELEALEDSFFLKGEEESEEKLSAGASAGEIMVRRKDAETKWTQLKTRELVLAQPSLYRFSSDAQEQNSGLPSAPVFSSSLNVDELD